MTEGTSRDPVAGFFAILALVAGVLSYIWVPFALAPLALIVLVVAVMLSPKYRGLYQVAVVVIAVGVVVGGAIAVMNDRAIY